MNERSAGRTLAPGLGVALLAHLVIFGLLSIAWGQRKDPRAWPEPTPIEVSLVTEVAPEAQAPPAPEPPAAASAPEEGAPEDAAPSSTSAPAPVPVTPAPPMPAPSRPEPKPAPAPLPRPQPALAKPTPPRPALAKPALPKPSLAKPAPSRPTPPRPTNRLAGLKLGNGNGETANAPGPRQRGPRLGDEIVRGLGADAPRNPPSNAAPGSKPGPYPTASIVGAIARQIQPCADRQVNPGPGANRIVTTLNIRLNRDGTLAATPTRVRQAGVNDENERYAQRVTDLGIAAFKGCSPLRLPSEYYQTAGGGWNNINYQWQLR